MAAETDSQSTSLTGLHTTNTTVHNLKPECDVKSVRWRHTLAGYFSFGFVSEEVEYLFFCICCGAYSVVGCGIMVYTTYYTFSFKSHREEHALAEGEDFLQCALITIQADALSRDLKSLVSTALSPVARQRVTVLLLLISLSLLHPPFIHTDPHALYSLRN